jgi:ATP-dependent Clp protease ATP-binding subunit ClpC
MFERFTDRARQVVVLAQDEARELGHGYIGTEHILLGLIREGHGVAAKALEAMDVSLPAIREQVEEIIGRGSVERPDPIPFTPRAKKALEMTWREAKLLGCDFVGTEHILLGLIHEGDGVAAQVLVKLGGDLDRTREQVSQLLFGKEQDRPQGVSRAFAAGGSSQPAEILARLDSVAMRLTAIERRLGILEARGQGHDALVSIHYRGECFTRVP